MAQAVIGYHKFNTVSFLYTQKRMSKFVAVVMRRAYHTSFHSLVAVCVSLNNF